MGKAVELITVQATAPGAGAAFTAVTGNSLTVRDSRAPVWLGPIWVNRQGAGFVRLTSPLMHDAVVGMQLQSAISSNSVLSRAVFQNLYPQDSIVVFGSGSATAGDIEQMSMLWVYEDLPGVDGYFINEAELNARAEDMYSWPNTISTGVGGGYSGQELVTTEADQLKANTDYAIIGAAISGTSTSIRYISSDWGNIGVGLPAITAAVAGPIETTNWFIKLSRLLNMPAIPVFNSSNKGLTFIDAAQNQTGGDPAVTTMSVRLKPKGRGKRQ